MTLLVSFKDVDVYDRDAALFNNNEWLNDTCIHFCFACLGNGLSTVKLVDPALVSFLRLQVEDDDEFEELALGLNIGDIEWLFLPINDNAGFGGYSTHWSLLLCHVASGQTFTLDSSRQSNFNSAKALLTKLCKLLKRPQLSIQPIPCPQQQNGHDCGIFVVLFAEHAVQFIASNPVSPDEAWATGLSSALTVAIPPALAGQTRLKYKETINQLARQP